MLPCKVELKMDLAIYCLVRDYLLVVFCFLSKRVWVGVRGMLWQNRFVMSRRHSIRLSF